MRRHPVYAYDWLAPIAFLRPSLDIPLDISQINRSLPQGIYIYRLIVQSREDGAQQVAHGKMILTK